MLEFDLQENGLRKLNSALHDQKENTNQTAWDVINPKGSHAIAVGIDAPIEVNINGSTGFSPSVRPWFVLSSKTKTKSRSEP